MKTIYACPRPGCEGRLGDYDGRDFWCGPEGEVIPAGEVMAGE